MTHGPLQNQPLPEHEHEDPNLHFLQLGSQFKDQIYRSLPDRVPGENDILHFVSDLGEDDKQPMYGNQLPKILVTGSTEYESSDSCYFQRQDAGKIKSAKVLVEQTYTALQSFNNQWLLKLAPSSELYARCSSLSSQWVFESGIRTLQKCYSGILPREFNEVFALMHLGFAFSHVLQLDHGLCGWDDLPIAKDLLLWRAALQTEDEDRMLVSICDRLWEPQTSYETSLRSDGLPEHVSYAAPFFIDSKMTVACSPTGLTYHETPENIPINCDPPESILKTLMTGTIIDWCSRYLERKITSILEGPCPD